jgi:SAM-dependent methyltransferase
MKVRINQALIERGRTPPWVWSREQCERFWRASGNGTEGNRPQDYAAKDRAIVDFLDRFWRPEVSSEDSILEIGCNAGTNLDRLRELGYAQLGGVEINPDALEMLRNAYPELAASAQLRLGPAETVLRELPDDAVDVVFTMAVLLHVHPSSHELFGDMARVARKYICTSRPSPGSVRTCSPGTTRACSAASGALRSSRFGCAALRSPRWASATSGTRRG